MNVRILDGEKEVYSDFGEMLFTHFGVSGPTILSASSYAAGIIKQKNLTLPPPSILSIGAQSGENKNSPIV